MRQYVATSSKPWLDILIVRKGVEVFHRQRRGSHLASSARVNIFRKCEWHWHLTCELGVCLDGISLVIKLTTLYGAFVFVDIDVDVFYK
jgi:hypothetical protein